MSSILYPSALIGPVNQVYDGALTYSYDVGHEILQLPRYYK